MYLGGGVCSEKPSNAGQKNHLTKKNLQVKGGGHKNQGRQKQNQGLKHSFPTKSTKAVGGGGRGKARRQEETTQKKKTLWKLPEKKSIKCRKMVCSD